METEEEIELIEGESYLIDTHGDIETVVYMNENTTPQIISRKVYWGRLPSGHWKSFYKSQVKGLA